ncbi:MAG: PTS fructose transporter subunit IIA [Candidatus Omnitrophica bacterium 4484_213]|nr:MAG: PTS fructose transporter subunit IIA [Candidatus Omnitrophica bacterium 4484_213]
MKIVDFLNQKAVSVNLLAKDKKGVIEELVDLLIKAGEAEQKDVLVKTLMEREELGSTGIGQGIAIPHGKSDTIRKLTGAVGISKQGVKFDALDGELVYIFFLLVAPRNSSGPHLKALARISRLLKDKNFCLSLRQAKSEKELLKIIIAEDKRQE